MNEIKKPEKRNNPEGLDRPIDFGYNTACDDWEKYLNALDKPKVDEGRLIKIIKDGLTTVEIFNGITTEKCPLFDFQIDDLAHEIAKRWKECVKLRSQRHS